MWKRGEIAPKEQFLLFSTIFCCLLVDLCIKTGTRFSLRDKRLFEISEFEITRVDCNIEKEMVHCTFHRSINPYKDFGRKWMKSCMHCYNLKKTVTNNCSHVEFLFIAFFNLYRTIELWGLFRDFSGYWNLCFIWRALWYFGLFKIYGYYNLFRATSIAKSSFEIRDILRNLYRVISKIYPLNCQNNLLVVYWIGSSGEKNHINSIYFIKYIPKENLTYRDSPSKSNFLRDMLNEQKELNLLVTTERYQDY